MAENKKAKLSPRMWFNLIVFGLMGQIAWNVENMYFNTFLYNSVYTGASQQAVDGSINVMTAISLMVALSAATAVITTFIMGTLSDRMNKRKVFISVGYIAWGVVTGAFGFISRDNVQAITGISDSVKILTITVSTVIVMDCVMTFMGSTSNDSAFNAWVTDVTEESNRPFVETVLAVLPIAATGIVVGLGAVLTQMGYEKFFIILGALVSVCGIMGLFSLTDSKNGKKKDGNYFADLIYGFRPSVIKENGGLYLALAAMSIFGIAVQVFFPYIILYLQHVILPASGELLSVKNIVCVVIALVFILAAFLGLMKGAEKIGRTKVFIISGVLFCVGLFLMYFMKDIGMLLLAAAPMGAGYALLTILFSASIRDMTPEDRVGQFQGVRMIFAVLLPMVFGPMIGNIAIQNSAVTYINEYNVEAILPSSLMFLCASVVGLLLFIPVIALNKKGMKK
ncbi:MAG: MFS transporter [Clostridia bacterium]|nr:MFS transporter [Clostridia bacterium]